MSATEAALPVVYYPGATEHSSARRRWVFTGAVLAVIVVLIAVVVYHAATLRPFGKQLAACGWSLYLLQGCGFCEKQLAMLGGSYTPSVMFASDGSVVSKSLPEHVAYSSIPAYPYWRNISTGEVRTGLQNAAALEAMARC